MSEDGILKFSHGKRFVKTDDQEKLQFVKCTCECMYEEHGNSVFK